MRLAPLRRGLIALAVSAAAAGLRVPVSAQPAAPAGPSPAAEQAELFESTVRPLLADNCYACHSGRVDPPFGGLRLDSREGLLAGGDSGPAVVPGRPAESALVERLHGRPVLMPPTGPLADDDIAALTRWVAVGAPWPEAAAAGAADPPDPSAPFDLPERRRAHWAWQPVQDALPPVVTDEGWPATPVDTFLLAALEDAGLAPAPDADRATLIRRLSFDLRGLPPTPAEIARFVADDSPTAYADLVDRFLASPHFGERWARHWMDLFRYSESHGSEGDPDIPFAWRYRDYLIRAFDGDVPYDQLIREHLAGDLLPEPRLDADGRTNESMLGPTQLRLVEHGFQPVDPWEDRVKWTDNQVDVASKAFLGLTVSCARCHDHKFDAISQKDYYAFFGTLYGARPTMRAVDAPAVLETNRDALAALKMDIRGRLADAWSAAAEGVAAELLAGLEPEAGDAEDAAAEDAAAGDAAEAAASAGGAGKPAQDPTSGSVLAVWRALAAVDAAEFPGAWHELRAHWEAEIPARERFNAEHFELLWDLGGPDYAATIGHGTGRPDAPSKPGEFAIERRGDRLLNGIHPAGAYTHLLSTKHPGVIQTPRFRIDSDYLSFRVLGGDLSFVQLIIENYSVPRGGIYHLRYSPKTDAMTWAQWDTEFWRGFTAYIEFATQDDATRFQLDPEDARLRHRPTRRGDGRSFIGAGRIVAHDEPRTPKETVVPVLALLGGPASAAATGTETPRAAVGPAGPGASRAAVGPGVDRAARYEGPASREDLAEWIGRRAGEAVAAWRDDRLTERQAAFLDELVRADLLPRSLETLVALREPVAEYRRLERAVPVPRRAPGVIDEAAPDQPLLVRGSHRNPGEVVPRGFLTAVDGRPYPDPGLVRLQLAEAVTDPGNPLTARVAVNRVWRHLFGYGIVRTVDNFGRLGDPPSHPALLDHLARGFVDDSYSIKGLVRRLVLSRAYRMGSQASARAAEHDPTNRLLQHANLRRLDAEAIRDAMLSISGRLDPTMYGPSVPVHYAARRGLTEGDPDNGPVDGDGRRSIYQEIRRNAHNPFLEVFDLPKPATTRGQRDTTNVPAQSLALLNSPFVIGQAAEWGRRLAEGEASSIDGRIRHMFVKALARPPDETEVARVADYLHATAAARGVDLSLLLHDAAVWQDVAHSLFNLKEFIFIP
ncbi:MAG: PSD1 and planctomycete cytochrome C domain-containing protein [Acidobacteria bacterium]|nr:PSD1 and planctomycete cytochrome C domain-containing protein [Acidobacteriota bacterium]